MPGTGGFRILETDADSRAAAEQGGAGREPKGAAGKGCPLLEKDTILQQQDTALQQKDTTLQQKDVLLAATLTWIAELEAEKGKE